MAVVVTSLIAIAGTLMGSVLAYFFQRQNAGRAEEFARLDRLRQERMAAYSAFAGAVTDHRRAVVNLWFRRAEDGEGPEFRTARSESDELGAALDRARFRVQLIADDPQLVALAQAASGPTSAIRRAKDNAEVLELEKRSRAAVAAFIENASAQILGKPVSISADGRPV